MLRVVAGWVLGMAIVPAVALLRYHYGCQNAEVADNSLHFALTLMWPIFMLVGSMGLCIVRIRSRAKRFRLLLLLGVFSGIAVAMLGPMFYPQLVGKEIKMLGQLIFDGLFCFTAFGYIAIGKPNDTPH